ncbi:hypothetical protein D9M68_902800 [compost metagenome]
MALMPLGKALCSQLTPLGADSANLSVGLAMLLPIAWSCRDGLPWVELLSSDIAINYHKQSIQ